MTPVEKQLIDAMAEMDIIDCHEHLGPESERIDNPADVFNLFSCYPYTGRDLMMAGMTYADYLSLCDQDMPLEDRWKTLEPYWERVRWTSYSRAILLAAEKFYGESEINESNYAAISERMSKANTKGIYDRVLRDACRIRKCLIVKDIPYVKTDILTPLNSVMMCDMESWSSVSHPQFAPNAQIKTLDDYLDSCKQYIVESKKDGVVGLKTVSLEYGEPDRQAALSEFGQLKSGKIERLAPAHNFPDWYPPTALRDYISDELVTFAGEQDLTVAVHAGYWGDFRKLNPLHIIPWLQRHPNVRFDVFHLGFPWMRETLMLCKGFPNVWLNLCWTHIISQQATIQALDEALDLVPTNKILAFGGDYTAPSIELVYGHLVMAREDIARVLARRTGEGQMTETQALDLARKWFWNNPVELYHLNL